MYNIRPEIDSEDWERFLRDEDIPFTLGFPSISGYRINRNDGDPEGLLSFRYLEEIDVTDLSAFIQDTKSDRWADGMDAWYQAGGASWYIFYPKDIQSAG